MTAPLRRGDFLLAVFPGLAGKRRLGVFLETIALGGGAWAAAVPATAQPGAKPGALGLAAPPAAGLKPCRLLATHLSLLRPARLDPLGARLDAEALARLEAMIAHWHGPAWRAPARLRRALARQGRLIPRSAKRRRGPYAQTGAAG